MKGRKTGGRQKGTPNRLGSRGGLVALACDAVGVNPFTELAVIAKNRKHPDHTRANAELAGFLAPKLRAIEHTGADGGAIELSVNPRELLASRIAALTPKPPRDSG